MTAYSVYHPALIAQPDGCGDVQNTHHTQAHHPLSFFSHTLSLTHTHTLTPCALHAYPDALSLYASCHWKLLWQHFASCLPIRCSFYLFSLLGSQSEVTRSPLILILSGVMLCNISVISLFFYVRLFYYMGKILNLKMVCLSVHEMEFEFK